MIKKNPKFNLENYKGIFLVAGMVLTLLTIYLVVENKTYEKMDYDSFAQEATAVLDEEDIPITEVQKKPPPPPPPPPPKPIEMLKIVKDNVEIEDVQIAPTEIDDNEAIDIYQFDDTEEDVPAMDFMVVENKPVFPGCENEPDEKAKYKCFQKKIHKHIAKNFKYPEIAMEMEIQGSVFVSFEIGKSGVITNIKVLRGIDKSLDVEASRLIGLLPSMIPAKQRGKPVPVKYTIPVKFKLSF